MTPAWLRVSLEQLLSDFCLTTLNRVEYRRPKNLLSNLFVIDEKRPPIMYLVNFAVECSHSVLLSVVKHAYNAMAFIDMHIIFESADSLHSQTASCLWLKSTRSYLLANQKALP
jgi:hypothetical protein